MYKLVKMQFKIHRETLEDDSMIPSFKRANNPPTVEMDVKTQLDQQKRLTVTSSVCLKVYIELIEHLVALVMKFDPCGHCKH